MAVELCAVRTCNRPRRKRGWCDRHYQAWRRHGDPLLAKFTVATSGGSCIVCGAPELMAKSRRFCSQRCVQLQRRRSRGERSHDSIVCVHCGTPVDIAPKPGERKVRSDLTRCADCTALRAIRLVGQGTVTIGFVRSLGTVCALCEQPVSFGGGGPKCDRPSLDHIVPVALGGTDDESNLQLTHFQCNQRKHLRSTTGDFGRDERQKLYRSRAWKKVAHAVRSEEPACRSCGAPSQCCDHVVSISCGGAVWHRANLQALCRRCHNAKSQREYRTQVAA